MLKKLKRRLTRDRDHYGPSKALSKGKAQCSGPLSAEASKSTSNSAFTSSRHRQAALIERHAIDDRVPAATYLCTDLVRQATYRSASALPLEGRGLDLYVPLACAASRLASIIGAADIRLTILNHLGPLPQTEPNRPGSLHRHRSRLPAGEDFDPDGADEITTRS